MDKLYAPWRGEYTKEVAHDSHDKNKNQETCVFCKQLQENNDEKNLILARYQHNFIVMNKYPYNGGHLLILPLEHVGTLGQLSTQASNEMMELIKKSTAILEKILKNTGTNVGFNIGKAAGAGIPSHLHAHVLPRWLGDTNFLPAISDAKQVSTDLGKLYQELKPHF